MSTNEYEMEQGPRLPEQLIIDEILIRLPVKTLCQFKSISKFWNGVISSAQFAKSHLMYATTHSNNSKFVFYQTVKYRRSCDNEVKSEKHSWLLNYEAYDDQDLNANWAQLSMENYVNPAGLHSLGEDLLAPLSGKTAHVIGSSCGLLCFLIKNNKISFRHPTVDQICICNPALRQWQFFSAPPPCSKMYPVLCGFGYVSSEDDFKLVLGAAGDYDNNSNGPIYVISLRNNNCGVAEENDKVNALARWAKLCGGNGRLLDERLHWMTVPYNIKDGDCRIFAFDLVHEVIDEIPIPEAWSSKDSAPFKLVESCGLSIIGGTLCLSIFRPVGNLQIWMMKQYGVKNSWVRLYDIGVHPIYYTEYHHDEFFGFTKTGKFLIRSRCTESYEEWFFLVDPNQSPPRLTPLVSLIDEEVHPVVDYFESLISPLGLGAVTLNEKKRDADEATHDKQS